MLLTWSDKYVNTQIDTCLLFTSIFSNFNSQNHAQLNEEAGHRNDAVVELVDQLIDEPVLDCLQGAKNLEIEAPVDCKCQRNVEEVDEQDGN